MNQTKYIGEIIKKLGMENAKRISTPMSLSCRLDKGENDRNIDKKFYQDIIGSLLYLTANRSDILFNIYICARFQANS